MSWAAPIIHAVGDILTASDWNISSNDLSFLAGTTWAEIATAQTTASTSYTDLSTVGPAVTVTTGANALVILTCQPSSTTTGVGYMSFAISGATTLAAADSNAMQNCDFTAGFLTQFSCIIPVGSLNAGSNTFTAKYRTNAGTETFSTRYIAVIPLP